MSATLKDIGVLNRRLVLEAPAETGDGAGGVVRTYEAVTTLWAQVTPVSGRGDVLSWVIFRRQYFDGIEPPHVVVAGELAEGPIVLADFDGDPTVLALDLAIELAVAPAEFDDGVTRPLYRWRASPGAG